MATAGVCEDDTSVRRVLTDALRFAGYEVTAAHTGHEALRLFATPGSVDVIVMDVGLPDSDGRDVCQALRAQGQHAPVLFLTALDAVHERVAGFASGGDDYVAKPFAISEVLARLQALQKRTRPQPAVSSELTLDPARFAVRAGAGEQPLTPTEYRLLAVLASEPGVVVRRRQAIAAAWPDGAIVHDNTLDSYIRRIRVKLAAIEAPVEVRTVRGVGYVLQHLEGAGPVAET